MPTCSAPSSLRESARPLPRHVKDILLVGEGGIWRDPPRAAKDALRTLRWPFIMRKRANGALGRKRGTMSSLYWRSRPRRF